MIKEFKKFNRLESLSGPLKPDGSDFTEGDMVNARHIEQPDFHSFVDKMIEIKKDSEDWNLIVYHDYDNDGFCAMMALSRLVYDMGIFNADNFAIISNNKFSEGYNPKLSILKKQLKALKINKLRKMEGTKTCIIVTDTGITDIKEIDKMKKYIGKDGVVAVMDHHEPDKDLEGTQILPKPDYLIDLKANTNTSPIDREYSAAGLNFVFLMQVAKRLKIESDEGNIPKYEVDPRAVAMRMASWAAIGTKGDSVPLEYGNYHILKVGMSYINNNNKNTIYTQKELVEMLLKKRPFGFHREIMPKVVTNTLDFELIPVLNAQMRLFGTMDKLYSVVVPETGITTEEHIIRSIQKVSSLQSDNAIRKQLSNELSRVKEIIFETDDIIVTTSEVKNMSIKKIDGKKVNPSGLIGPLASQNLTSFNKDIALAGYLSEDKYHFSARGKGIYSLSDFINSQKNKYPNGEVSGGGHGGAAGVNVHVSVWKDFLKDFKDYIKVTKEEVLQEVKNELISRGFDKNTVESSIDEKFNCKDSSIQKELEGILVDFKVNEYSEFPYFKDGDFSSIIEDGEFIKELEIIGMGRNAPVFILSKDDYSGSIKVKTTFKKLFKKVNKVQSRSEPVYFSSKEALFLFKPDSIFFKEVMYSGMNVTEKDIEDFKDFVSEGNEIFSKVYANIADLHNKPVDYVVSSITKVLEQDSKYTNNDAISRMFIIAFGSVYLKEENLKLIPSINISSEISSVDVSGFVSTLMKYNLDIPDEIEVQVIPKDNHGTRKPILVLQVK